jgi:putative endonuclease
VENGAANSNDLFKHRSPHRADPPRSFPGVENQELASILQCPATGNLYLRVMQRKEARWKVSLRPTAASARSALKATKTFAQPSLGKQLKGPRREKKLNIIRTINLEFKDLAQTWGWKMIYSA